MVPFMVTLSIKNDANNPLGSVCRYTETPANAPRATRSTATTIFFMVLAFKKNISVGCE